MEACEGGAGKGRGVIQRGARREIKRFYPCAASAFHEGYNTVGA